MKKTFALLFVIVFFFTSCGSSQKKVKTKYRKGTYSERYSRTGSIDDIIYDNLEHRSGSGISYSRSLKTSKKFDIPYTYNRYVEKWVVYFTGRGRRHFARYLARLGRFMPYIHAVTDHYGVPRDLVYLSMIESGFNVRAKSWASAVGPWQFIKSTGAMYGLNVDYYVDERRDVEKSTHAAARHLRDLYEDFGHWYLAFAAYNAGPGKVRNAIRKHGRNYWDMLRGRYLRQETKDYVPKIIAAAMIAKNPEKYGFRNIRYQRMVAYDKVTLKGPTDLEVAAECAGVDPDLIRLLNPELLRDMTPPHIPNYRLKIPRGTKSRFRRQYAKLRPSQRVKIHYYTTQRGDTVKSVAKQYGVSQSSLAKANPGKIKAHKKRYTKRVKVRYRHKGRRRYRWKKKRYTVTSYTVRSGQRLTIPKSRSLASYSSLRDDKAAYRAHHRYGMKVASVSPELSKKQKKKARKNKKKKDQGVYTLVEAEAYPPSKPQPKPAVKSDLDLDDLTFSERSSAKTPTSFEDTAVARLPQKPSDAELKQAVRSLPTNSDLPDEASDPENRKKWVATKYHVVRRGETLNQIAKRYAVSVAELRAWNGKKVHPVLKSGVKIQVSGGKPVAKAPASKPTYYRVKSGDTLGGIAKRFGVKISQLKAWNGKKVSPVLQRGAKIRVRGGPGASVTTARPKSRYYRVRSGDTLSGIAKRFGVKTSQLKAWNGKKVSPVLQKGAKIVVRGPQVVKYRVKPGDNLHKIAKKHATTPAQLKKLNGLKSNTIRPGAVLVVRRK